VTAAAKRSGEADAGRKDMLAKAHIAKKELGLDDASYRDLLERVVGKRSAKELTRAELDQVLAEFKRLGWRHKPRQQPARAGTRPIADGEIQGKARALWLALYHLGVVRSPAEAALDRFCKRQTGADSLRWISPERASRLIEALKDWAVRDAGVTWPDADVVKRVSWQRSQMAKPAEGDADTIALKAAVIHAQWRLLQRAGAFDRGIFARPDTWLHNQGYHVSGPEFLSTHDADQVIERLGTWLRRRLKDTGASPRDLVKG
jgi:phage gp16-like protein